MIYTPASQAGVPLSNLSSFDPPPKDILLDSVLFSTASSLLALMSIKADPLKSKEHILLSTIFENEWKEG